MKFSFLLPLILCLVLSHTLVQSQKTAAAALHRVLPADSVQNALRHAESCMMSGKYSEGYNRLQSFTEINGPTKETLILQGKLLRRMGRLQEARQVYRYLSRFSEEEAQKGLNHCDFAQAKLEGMPDFDVFVLPFNTTSSDFALSFVHGNPTFTKYRPNQERQNKEGITDSSIPASMMYDTESSQLFSRQYESGIHHMFDVIQTSPRGGKAVALRGIGQDKLVPGYSVEQTNLYLCNVDSSGQILTAQEWPFLSDHPYVHSASLSDDGNTLLFSSKGKNHYSHYDLYMTQLSNGKWTEPVTIGSPVNTKGNEITPFLQNGILYFASDAHAGLGGFDIFYSAFTENIWLPPRNIGSGCNSTGDDYYPASDGTGIFYFTSNRLGGRGMNDLYGAVRLPSSVPVPVSAPVYTESIPHTPNAETLHNVAWQEKRIEMKIANADKQQSDKKSSLKEVKSNEVSNHPLLWGTETEAVSPDGPAVEYMVRLAAYRDTRWFDAQKVKDLGKPGFIQQDQWTIFYLTGFTDPTDAGNAANLARKRGFTGAYVTQKIIQLTATAGQE